MFSGTRLLLFLFLSALIVMQAACKNQEQPQISRTAEQSPQERLSSSTVKPLRIGMGAMITPKEGFIYYRQLSEYIEKKLGHPVQLVDRGNYDEMNRLLETKEIDAAFVCAGPYVEGKERFGMELLAMPLVKGKPVYHSYIIVPAGSPAQKLEDLRGKTFAFTDPKSNSGKLVPTYLLAKMKETPQHFFGKVEFTYGHDKSIKAVAEGLVDGAAVDSLIWEYLALKHPDMAAKTRILLRSEPYGIPPVVVRPGLDAEKKKRLLQILLQVSDDEEGRQILKGMMIDRFVAGDDSNYDTIRGMNRWLLKQGKQP
ncbi:MAG: phosphate/phosphite/phosphonate ABC transporter substrate-binding protein [Geobacteraceae bacterium]|nr:phosphate/phosphite/phosphonate ABC transporter substrate-binding protein [Geobacteraceae bacterium]